MDDLVGFDEASINLNEPKRPGLVYSSLVPRLELVLNGVNLDVEQGRACSKHKTTVRLLNNIDAVIKPGGVSHVFCCFFKLTLSLT
jgi:hypothetical protein